MICADVERDLDLYVDRELSPELAAAIRDHLDTCAACRQRVGGREALGRAVRSVPYRTAPDRLRARVAGQAKRTSSTRALLAWAAAVILAVAIGGSGWALIRSAARAGASGADVVVAEVVSAHVRSLQAEHLFDVQSSDQHTVKPWFLGKLDFAPPVADLAAMGFPLVGGRLDYVSGRPVAALVYRRQQHSINVFVWPTSETSGTDTARSVRGFHVHHWIRDGMSFWVVSDLNDAELSEFAGALQRS
jgi:anti-sigma factor (TIGR02949 family)